MSLHHGLVVLSLAGALLGLSGTGVGAACESVRCSCIQPPPPQVARTAADAVFLGTVVGLREIELDLDHSEVGYHVREITFQVHAAWRGLETATERVVVTTGLGGGDCGFEFTRDSIYLVYANGSDGKLSTSICSRTALASDAEEDFEALGQPQLVLD